VKILHCIPSMEGGGAERQLTYLVKEHVGAGCDVHVALTRGGANLSRLEAAGATIHRLGPILNHDPRIAARLVRLIAAIKPDLVQCWLRQMELLAGTVCVMTRTPWLFCERSSKHAYPPTLKNALRVRIASFATAVVSNSKAGDQYWRERLPSKVPRYVIANAVPIDEIALAPKATAEEAGTQPGTALLLYAGRLDAAKNALALVKALRMLPRNLPVTTLLCGDGPMRGEITRAMQDLPPGRVVLAGYATNLWSLMKRAAAFVSPSKFEGNPNVVLEAMACACPLIVSDIPAHRELLDEQSALLVSEADPEGFAHAITTVLADPLAAARRAAVARCRVERNGAGEVAQRYLTAYAEMLARHGRRSRVPA